MCTGIGWNGSDVIYGYNLDIDPEVWNYRIIKNKNVFTVAITVGKRIYYTHGVNRDGGFGCLPYMNGEVGKDARKGKNSERLDLLTDSYIRGRTDFDGVRETVREKRITDVKGLSMHSLFGDGRGNMLLVEPGSGYREIANRFAVIANYPIIDEPGGESPFYGKERAKLANRLLSESGRDFSAKDALAVLERVKQEGQWATRLSFVFSKNENRVLYALNGDFDDIKEHKFD